MDISKKNNPVKWFQYNDDERYKLKWLSPYAITEIKDETFIRENLLDWEGVNADGEKAECSESNKKKFIQSFEGNERLVWMVGKAMDSKNFTDLDDAKKVKALLYWQFDNPNASIELCDECKAERNSRVACPGCPFGSRPQVDGQTGFFISAYNMLEQAKEYGFCNDVMQMLHIDSEFKYFILMEVIAFIKEIMAEHEERKLKRLQHGNKHRR